PLSYVAGALIGNPSIQCFSTSVDGERRKVSCVEAFKEHGLEHVEFEAKEHLGLLNGTAFSASVAGLAMQETVNLTMISLVATAMGT
ncbi:UNVERIFIED_CONTAM: aromatic amino acid ammonia-lyase, partial [Prevotella sp. 15_C9]